MPASPSASVFINCPFDRQYQPLFDATVFCVVECGFVPRCTLEFTDAGEVRIENIYRLVDQCDHSIHDISRTEVEGQPYKLPRFNMPLELGIFLGAKTVRETLLAEALSNHGSRTLSVHAFHLGYWRPGHSGAQQKPGQGDSPCSRLASIRSRENQNPRWRDNLETISAVSARTACHCGRNRARSESAHIHRLPSARNHLAQRAPLI